MGDVAVLLDKAKNTLKASLKAVFMGLLRRPASGHKAWSVSVRYAHKSLKING